MQASRGVAGVSGNGQSELVEVLCGQRHQERWLGGMYQASRIRPARSQCQSLRVHVLPELPLTNACVPNMSVSENIALRSSISHRSTRWLVRVDASDRERAALLIQRFGIKTPSPSTPIRNLSGGNIHAMLARELSEPATYSCSQSMLRPDFAASADVRAEIVDAAPTVALPCC